MGIFILITYNIIKVLKNQAELIRTFEAKTWRYDKAESGHVRIWSQLVKKKLGNPDPESMNLLYGGLTHISLLLWDIHWNNLQNDA